MKKTSLLSGNTLLSKAKKVAKECGYYNTSEDGKKHLNMTDFSNAILAARKNISEKDNLIQTDIEDRSFLESKKKPVWFLLSLFICIVSIIVFAHTKLSSNNSSKKTLENTQVVSPPQTVIVGNVTTTNIPRMLNTKGTIVARNLISIIPQRGGQIRRILVNEGDMVKAGQPLVFIDDSELQTQISQAQAKVQSEHGVLQQKLAILTSTKANAAQARAEEQQLHANLAQAIAKQLQAQQKLERYRYLAAQGATSQDTLQTYETDLTTQIASVRAAQASIKSSKEKIKSALAAISSAEASIYSVQADVRNNIAKTSQIQAQLEQTIVRAPSSGIITRPQVEGKIQEIAQIGDFSVSTKPLFSLISNAQLEVQAEVPSGELPKIVVGAAAQITSEANNRVQIVGKVRNVEQLVNAINRQMIVKIDLPQTAFLRPGMFTKVAIIIDTTVSQIIPAKAVQFQTDKSALVFVLSGENIVRAQKVEVGEILSGNQVEIKTGLKRTDRIIIAGAEYIKDGDKVNITNNK
jgi:HlyD family secretion protein